jgi:hypothetical protein
VELYTASPEDTMVICADESGGGERTHARARPVGRRTPDQGAALVVIGNAEDRHLAG